MSNHYNLYDSLGIDRGASTEELRRSLTARLEELRGSGATDYSGPVQELSAAVKVLGDEYRRGLYDQRLDDDSQPDITISSIRSLASAPSPTEQTPPWASPAQAPTQVAQAPAAPAAPPKVAVPVEPLADDAPLEAMWNRLPQLPRIAMGLFAAASVAGVLLALVGFFNEDYFVLLTPSYVAIGMILLVVPLHWTRQILLGRDNTATLFLPASIAPLGIFTLILAFFLNDAVVVALLGLASTVLIAALIISFLPDTRAWFRGQRLVPAQNSAPAQAATDNTQPTTDTNNQVD
nr:hypothetical protein [Corynebacterium lactis]